jgi:GT2 family glycosyltransferase
MTEIGVQRGLPTVVPEWKGYQAPAPERERVRVDGKLFARGQRRFRVQGVTYGPFAPDAARSPFPSPARVADDFVRMAAVGINAIRTYHVPPPWLLGRADEQSLAVLIDVPWRKHLCFLESSEAQREARQAVRDAAALGRDFACVLAYSIGNEIPPDVLRWHGRRRVERFLAELADVVKQTDPAGLTTYASYPPTEYLDLACIDFATFNVYLHDRETFRRYLFRLQNLVGDRPLLLGELGMDTLRHGETAQAEFLAGHVAETRLMGLAGAFVFAWTDDWHTGGYPIQAWAFGITRADRSPKASYHALREVLEAAPWEGLSKAPRVSVVVCSYNGGATLEQCVQSLLDLDYPDYEIIVVDDGSTDQTPEILARYDGQIRVIRQPNQGLSAARNVGLREATGEIVAYTDSDCFADPDWLTHLVYQLQRSGAAAVGGPNLTPEDGWLAACVAASPGQPTHVLESDQVAEHVPGCNMAFRREALLAINGFDPLYRKAGDDVDVCWRLQQSGRWITFAPGGFVWHHRRQGPRTYLRQQAGYGEAEALLQTQHPERFNSRGEGKWRGVLYGASLRGLCLSEPIVYRGTYAAGLFQCVYQPGPAHWAMLPGTLEWHLAAGVSALGALVWLPMLAVAAAMIGLSLLVAVLQARQARLELKHEGACSRFVIAGLCYAQPLVRSWARYRRRFFGARQAAREPALLRAGARGLPLWGMRTTAYWTEEWRDRTELLDGVVAALDEQRWTKVIDAGWSDWDLEVVAHPWTVVRICTTQEEHGGKKRLIRVRYQLRLRGQAKAAVGAGIVVTAIATLTHLGVGAACAAAVLLALAAVWWHGARWAARTVGLVDAAACKLRLLSCPGHNEASAPTETGR